MATKTKALVSIDEHVRKHGSVAEAARVAELDYYQFYRWFKRLVYAPDHGSSRKIAALAGIDLPRREEKR